MLTKESQLGVMTRLGRAMSDPTRARVLIALLDAPGYPAGLARDLDLTRSNVSNHLACLRGCGLVVAEPEGRRTRYEIADPHLGAALATLVNVVLAVDDGAPCQGDGCPLGCCGDLSFLVTSVDTAADRDVDRDGDRDAAAEVDA